MKPPYSEEELKSYFDGFERMGETSVRAAINSDLWRNEQLRLGAAKEWIRQIDEARHSPPPKPWHEKWWGKLIIGAILVFFGWLLGLYKDYYLPKDRLLSQPPQIRQNIETQK